MPPFKTIQRTYVRTSTALAIVLFFAVSAAAGVILYTRKSTNDISELQTILTTRQQSKQQKQKPTYKKGEIIVKFNDRLPVNAQEAFTMKRGFSAYIQQGFSTQRPAPIDDLLRKYNVQSIEPVFKFQKQRKDIKPGAKNITPQSRAQMKAAWQNHIDAIKRKYPQRTKRTPKSAKIPDLSHTYALKVPDNTNIELAIRDFSVDPSVEYAQPNYLMTTYGFPETLPNDTYIDPDQNGIWSKGAWGQNYEDMWGLKIIQADKAWQITQGEGVTVAVVDTGIDYNHPDIKDNIWINPGEDVNNNGIVDPDDFNNIDNDGNGFIDDIRGWDFGDNDNNPMDDMAGHGTHVAGTIAAQGNNNEGIIGVAPKAQIMMVKGFSSGDNLTGSQELADSLLYATANGADVINNSWGCSGGCPTNQVIEDAVHIAYELGTVIVFAAGNDDNDISNYTPQNMSETITVASIDHLSQRSDFSNWGAYIDVAAPGGESGYLYNTPDGSLCIDHTKASILSLRDDNLDPLNGSPCYTPGSAIEGNKYYRLLGTSMSSPHAAGAAALLVSHRPEFTNKDIKLALRASADDINTPGFDPKTGAGQINITKALIMRSVLDVKITQPSSNADLSQKDGSIEIKGTANGSNFESYQLSYGKGSMPTDYTPISPSVDNPVINGSLGVWSIENLDDGDYILILTAKTNDNFYFQDAIRIFLERDKPKQISFIKPWHFITSYSIYGNFIAWTDYDWGHGEDIYLYDITKEETNLITNKNFPLPSLNNSRPQLFKNYMLFQSETYPNGEQSIDIWLYNLTNGEMRQITTYPAFRKNIAISGNYIAWSELITDNNWSVHLFDLSSNNERKITEGILSIDDVAISNMFVIWTNWGKSNLPATIYAYNISDNTIKPLNKGDNRDFQRFGSIYGNSIVWSAGHDDDFNIYLYNASTKKQTEIINYPSNQYEPDLFGDYVTWLDERDGSLNRNSIYLYDLARNNEILISNYPSLKNKALIFGNRIIWTDTRSGQNSKIESMGDIFMYELPNKPPGINSTSPQSATPNTLLSFLISATDKERDILTFSFDKLPLGSKLFPLGDVNKDGKITEEDSKLILSCFVALEICDTEQQVLGDINKDGQLTSSDALNVQTMSTPGYEENEDILNLINTSIFLWTPTENQTGDYNITFKTTDSQQGKSTITVPITVSSVPSFFQNLLLNPSFEEGKSSWSGWGSSKILTNESSFDEDYSAKFILSGRTKKLTHNLINIADDKIYSVSGNIRTIDSTGDAYIQIEWEKGRKTLRRDIIGSIKGTTGWVRKEDFLTPPQGAKKVKIRLITNKGSGTVYFDNILFGEN